MKKVCANCKICKLWLDAGKKPPNFLCIYNDWMSGLTRRIEDIDNHTCEWFDIFNLKLDPKNIKWPKPKNAASARMDYNFYPPLSIRKKMSCLSRDGVDRFWEEAAKIFSKEYETCNKKEDNL